MMTVDNLSGTAGMFIFARCASDSVSSVCVSDASYLSMSIVDGRPTSKAGIRTVVQTTHAKKECSARPLRAGFNGEGAGRAGGIDCRSPRKRLDYLYQLCINE